ncbi:MAG: S8 family peptidase [Cyclobacteriaceae bacterium]|nr:S8 family peptidase [Cyclobacteriaceae bacterium]
MTLTLRRFLVSFFLIVLGGAVYPALGQGSDVPKEWFLLDPEQNHVQGVSAERAYLELLKGRPSTPVTVAIIDSGIDIDHEDLKRIIWTNPKEIAGNGMDDDQNGYIDDIHGWNFIGGKGGEVIEDSYELTREYIRLKQKFGTVTEDKVPSKQRKEYESFKKIKDKFIRLQEENRSEYEYYLKLNKNLEASMDTLKSVLQTDHLSREAIDSLRSTSASVSFAKGFTKMMLRNAGDDADLEEIHKNLQEAVDHYRVIVEYGYNPDYDSRVLIGDDYSNPRERVYGNNNIKGPDPMHGTHVAGIIAADRSNAIGIKGIADNVRIMSLRAVPNGDERDKDIANAIRYAADNGAQIINMSFGKSISPQKEVVDEAVAYAQKKGVLIIHGSGNERQDNDKEGNYPNRKYLNGKEALGWLEVGATSSGSGKEFVADFSNYGKKTVDVFAPGVDIYSTVPNNGYEPKSGTSMAAPVVTGIAALVWSYYPGFTAEQIADIIKTSSRKFDGLKVKRPGGGESEFNELSVTGGLVNAYAALALAASRQSQSDNRLKK